MSRGPVRDQAGSYRQGLVLGLTMAEVLLLLLFCLAIALGASIRREREGRHAAEASLSATRARLAAAEEVLRADAAPVAAAKAAPGLREALDAVSDNGAHPEEIDRFWRRLVRSDAAASALARAGIPAERAQAEAGRLAALDRALRAATSAGRDAAPEDVARDALLGANARDALARSGGSGGDAGVIQAIERGARAPESGSWLASLRGGRHDWPPIVSLTEADGFYFARGRADLTPDFAERLDRSVVPRILEIVRSYDVDTIEVVGHTDEQPLAARASNLDRGFAPVIQGRAGIDSLQAGDNAGLGLARAVSVATRLLADPRLGSLRVLPLSGGQLIGTDQTLTLGNSGDDVRQRRRIEIRLRQSRP